ncbi:MAG: hypothetical protein JSU63_05040 [Phycisphaerales bacterium]|nr:MAG: hypothetical protein JSU63_05040 [Phycisphaerales bacterium]
MDDRQTVHRRASSRLLVSVVIVVALVGVGLTSTDALISVILGGVEALLVIAGPLLMGLWLVPLFRLGPMPLRWHLLLGVALGLGATSILILVMGLAGLLQRPIWMFLQVLFVGFGVVRLRGLLAKQRLPAEAEASGNEDHGTAGRYLSLWLLACPFLCLALLAASNAPGFIWEEEGFGYDVLEYHLQMPKEYLQAASITYAPHNVYANFPANVEMLYLLAMILLDDYLDVGVVANMIHLFLAVLTVFAAWVAGWEWSARTGIVCGVVMATVGWLAYLSGLAYVEDGMLLFGTTATALVLSTVKNTHNPSRPDMRRDEGADLAEGGPCPSDMGETMTDARDDDDDHRLPHLQRRWGTYRLRLFILAGVVTGFACGCKYTAVPMIAVPLAAVVLCVSGYSLKSRLAYTVAFALAALLTFSPWLIKNQAMTGNPVFPLANKFFAASPPGWGVEETERWDRGHTPSPQEGALTARLGALWRHVPADRYQRFGPLVILLPVVGLFGRRRGRTDLILLIILFMQFAVWLGATHLYARFAVVMLIPLALLCGRSVVDTGSTIRMRVIAGALYVGASWNAAFAIGLHRAQSPHGAPASLIYEGELPGYEYLKVVNRDLPADAKIILVGDAKAFYFQRRVDYCVVFNRNPFVEAIRSGEDDAGIVQWLRDKGYTRILVNWFEIDRLSATYGFAPEVNPALFERLGPLGLSVAGEFPHPTSGGRYVTLYEVGGN